MPVADLAGFTKENLITLGRKISNGKLGVDYDRMTKADLATYIASRYHASTIGDTLAALQREGMIKTLADSNARALGNEARCGGLVHTPAGATVGCKLLAGHDGPCAPEGGAVANGLKAAMQQAKANPMSPALGFCTVCGAPTMRKWFTLCFKHWKEEKDKQAQASGNEPQNEPASAPQNAPPSGPTMDGTGAHALPPVLGQGDLFEGVRKLADLLDGDRERTMTEHVGLVESLLSERIAKLEASRPVVVQVTFPELPEPRTLARRPHVAFPKILALVRAGLNVAMIGPAGSGKTTLAADIAEALGRPHGMISLTAGVSEASVLGRLLPLGANGSFRWIGSPFTCLFGGEKVTVSKDGTPIVVSDDSAAGVFLFDECDAADPNMLVTLNSALANKRLTIEQRAASGLSVELHQHSTSTLLAAMNTFGTGMDLLYAGRNALDAAFLDRWYPVHVGYDPVLEASIGGLPVPNLPTWQTAVKPSETELRSLASWVLHVRKVCEDRKFRRVVGTRMIQKALAARRAGIPTAEVKNDLLLGWTPDEKASIAQGFGA